MDCSISSGLYSGGEPAKVYVSLEQYVNLSDLFESAFKSKNAHAVQRAKMTGLILKITPKGSTQIILKPESPEVQDIERELKSVLFN